MMAMMFAVMGGVVVLNISNPDTTFAQARRPSTMLGGAVFSLSYGPQAHHQHRHGFDR